MSESRIERLQRLFLETLEQPEEVRESWLAKQCGTDNDLFEEIRTLLKHDELSRDPLENPLQEAIGVSDFIETSFAEPGTDGTGGQVPVRALHVRCPHCRNPIEIVEELSLNQLDCPSCGSHFSLLGDESVEAEDGEKRTIAHYVLEKRVGTGAFGSVWKAHDETLDRIVALKMPRAGQLSALESELFLREARSAARLKHPNIVPVHEVGRIDGQIYIVSDYIEGAPLSEHLASGPLKPRESAELIMKIANALHHAHEAGVIHRDLKPSNIVMDQESEPHLVDFGLAKREAGEITITADGKILGTPAYMSPELARGEASTVDARSDVYSIGVVLFELLTGQKPFRGTTQTLLHQVIHDEPPRTRQLKPSVSRDLDLICSRCLHKNPDKRYPTAQDLASDLENYLTGKPIAAKPASSVGRLNRWCRRRIKPATMVGAVFLIFCAAWRALLGESPVPPNEAIDASATVEFSPVRTFDIAQDGQHVAVVSDESESVGIWKIGVDDPMRYLEGHAGGVNTVAFSPDGWRIASGGKDGMVKLWDTRTRLEMLQFPAHREFVHALAFSPDSQWLATCGGDDRTAKIWNASTGDLVQTIKHPGYVANLVFSPDGTQVAAGGCNKPFSETDSQTEPFPGPCVVMISDPISGEEYANLKGHGWRTHMTRFSPNGGLLASACVGGARLWDWSAEQERFTTNDRVSFGAAVFSVSFTPDGRHLVTAGANNEAVVWDTSTGKDVLALQHSERLRDVTISHDGRWLATGTTSGTVAIWNLASGEPYLVRKAHTGSVLVRFTPDDAWLVSAGRDGLIKTWAIGELVIENQTGLKSASLTGN